MHGLRDLTLFCCSSFRCSVPCRRMSSGDIYDMRLRHAPRRGEATAADGAHAAPRHRPNRATLQYVSSTSPQLTALTRLSLMHSEMLPECAGVVTGALRQMPQLRALCVSDTEADSSNSRWHRAQHGSEDRDSGFYSSFQDGDFVHAVYRDCRSRTPPKFLNCCMHATS